MSASCFQICNLCSVGGLKKGLVVELANGSNAMVLKITGDTCMHLHFGLGIQSLHNL